ELGLEAAIVVLAVLSLAIRFKTGRARQLLCVPNLALAGLALLAAFQTVPLPDGMLGRIAPATQALRASPVPGTPQRVNGESGAAVAPPARVVSLDPDATLHNAAQLAAAWVLFQCVLGYRGGYPAFRRFGMFVAGNATLLTLFALAQSLTW